MNDAIDKETLRNLYIKKRKKLSPKKLFFVSKKILENLQTLNIWNYNYYHIFLPIKKMREINTCPIINDMWRQNKNVIIPKIKGIELCSYLFEPTTTLEKNKLDIYEPSNSSSKRIDSKLIQVVFIPLLCFDKKGHRVGYGKGYYDRFLKSIPKALKIGLSAFDPIDSSINVNKFDIKMNYCVNCKRIYKFT